MIVQLFSVTETPNKKLPKITLHFFGRVTPSEPRYTTAKVMNSFQSFDNETSAND